MTQGPLVLGGQSFEPGQLLVMAIVNRTPDSFFDRGRTFDRGPALARIDEAVAEGADIVDIGGVKAGPGTEVPEPEKLRRVVDLVRRCKERHPEVIVSVDTYRAAVADAACAAGADLVNDAWGGWDPGVAAVAGRYGAGLVCTHAGGLPPRTRPHRVEHTNVVDEVTETVSRHAYRGNWSRYSEYGT